MNKPEPSLIIAYTLILSYFLSSIFTDSKIISYSFLIGSLISLDFISKHKEYKQNYFIFISMLILFGVAVYLPHKIYRQNFQNQ
jgi:hypothetical protein